jgi:hypothetical protein
LDPTKEQQQFRANLEKRAPEIPVMIRQALGEERMSRTRVFE